MSKKSERKRDRKRKAASAVHREPSAQGSEWNYREELERLQVELAHLQAWVKATGARIVVLFEGRDAAGKGGIIKRITESVSPRVFRVIALPTPTDREKSQIFMQRYIAHLPAAGEIVIFDRSWYNRAGVERVMGFCSEKQARRFLELAPRFEAAIVEAGIILIKYFIDVSEAEQERRFRQRIDDPVRQWKLSPMDIESYRRWWDYTRAYDDMIRATDTDHAPWWIVPSDDKKRARVNCIAHFLSLLPYEHVPFDEPRLGKRQKRPRGTEDAGYRARRVPDVSMQGRHASAETFNETRPSEEKEAPAPRSGDRTGTPHHIDAG